jgi:anion-transporting  ArsA/GET3 family ATPase
MDRASDTRTSAHTPPILFVTGKGGVGKSTIAAGLALQQARAGQRTLLAELGDTSFYEQWFNMPIGHTPQPTPLDPRLSVCRWEAQTCLKEYLLHYLRVASLVNLFFENKVMRSLVQAAPALREIALLGKITSGQRQVGPAMPYDVIVIDAFSTGHFQALMQTPLGLAQAVRFGPMGEQSRAIHQVLVDPQQTQFVVVCLPEELPVTETLELQKWLRDFLHVEPRLVLNRWLALPPPYTATAGEKADAVAALFLADVQTLRERQERSRQQLATPVIVPYSLELDPLERLRALAAGAL